MSAGPARLSFGAELEQLRLQVELMAVRVDANLERVRTFLADGLPVPLALAYRADDEIDAMNVSLTERCYDLLRREAPVASDLRFVVSVVRVVSELERIGDLALRVLNLEDERDLLLSNVATIEILRAMADHAVERYREALRAWATMDLGLATDLAASSGSGDMFHDRMVAELLVLQGPDAVRVAVATFAAGRSLERIDDHAGIIGARLRYLLTGNPDHLAAEVR